MKKRENLLRRNSDLLSNTTKFYSSDGKKQQGIILCKIFRLEISPFVDGDMERVGQILRPF